jgi:serine/threonine protein kinase
MLLLFNVQACDTTQAMPMVRYANPHTHKALLFQVLRALHAMHSADLYHWDLRPENVLLSEDCDVILRGLGLAGSVASRHHAGQLPAEISTAPVRNQWYHPPELLMHEEEGRVVTWAHAIDIWGAACVFLELVLGRPIFGAANGVEQLIRITNELGIPPTSMDHKVDAMQSLTKLLS